MPAMTTRVPAPRIPAVAERMRRDLWLRSRRLVQQRWGIDIDAPQALEQARALVADRPGDAETHLLLGSVLAMRGEVEAAEDEVRRAVELSPRLARARTTLAAILVRRGAHEEALRQARNAAAVDLEDPTVLYNLGLAEWVGGDRRTAKAAFRHAEEILRRESGGGIQRRPWWRRWRGG